MTHDPDISESIRRITEYLNHETLNQEYTHLLTWGRLLFYSSTLRHCHIFPAAGTTQTVYNGPGSHQHVRPLAVGVP